MVAQKAAPIFAWFWKIPLVWDADKIQSCIAISLINYNNILSWFRCLVHAIWIKTHEVLDQMKSSLIGQFVESLLFFLIFSCYTPIEGKKNSCGNSKQCHVALFVSIWPVEIVSTASWHLTTIMKSISTAQRSSIISLLNERYSHHQIQARTGLRKGTVGRISKEWDGNKENNSGGHPSKHYPSNQIWKAW